MSEPDSAFLKLEIDRHSLVRWMRAKPSSASRWNDWRSIGGEWHLDSAVGKLADASDAWLANTLADADRKLATQATNHELLGAVVGITDTPELWIAAFDKAEKTFLAGSMTYSENLGDFILFLAMARSVADYLPPSGHGLVLVQNFIWGDDDGAPTAAIRLMPTKESSFLSSRESANAGAAFQPIADAMQEGKLPPGFAMRDHLRLLR